VSIIHAAYPAKPSLVVRYALPAALSLLNDGKGDSKAAATALLTALAQHMGTGLLVHAEGLNPALQQKVVDVVNMYTG